MGLKQLILEHYRKLIFIGLYKIKATRVSKIINQSFEYIKKIYQNFKLSGYIPQSFPNKIHFSKFIIYDD